ncbi:MAG TPA: MFS transporter [Marmoricola sp.]|nr:MFS transporter [Marmoricola sp.]
MPRGGRASRLLPPTSLGRSLALQSALYAVGTGVFVSGNAVYFTRVVGLTPGMVGLGISLGGAVSMLAAVPAGRWADRLGLRGSWACAAFVEALLYLAYPFVHGLGGFVLLLGLLALAQALGAGGRGGYVLAAVPRGQRVRVLAFVRSALNIGFTVGAMLAGLALATGDAAVVRAIPVATAAVLLVNGVLVARLPVAPAHARDAPPEPGRAALRNRRFVLLSGLNGLMAVDQVLLSVVFPLWLVSRTDAPHAVLAWLYGTNTVLVVLLQVRASRGSETVAGAARSVRVAGLAALAACSVVMTTAWSAGGATVVLLWLGYVLLTGAELFHSAGGWGFLSELSDPERRGEYQGVWKLGQQAQLMAGPVTCTWLAVTWRPEGLLVIGAVAVSASLLMAGAASGARRWLEAGKPAGVRRVGVDTIERSGPATR